MEKKINHLKTGSPVSFQGFLGLYFNFNLLKLRELVLLFTFFLNEGCSGLGFAHTFLYGLDSERSRAF